jgi:hypothetical protein
METQLGIQTHLFTEILLINYTVFIEQFIAIGQKDIQRGCGTRWSVSRSPAIGISYLGLVECSLHLKLFVSSITIPTLPLDFAHDLLSWIL